MSASLFRPFDLKKWLVLGFTAWLAGLTSGGGWSGSSNYRPRPGELEGVSRGLEDVWHQLAEHAVWLGLAALGCALLVAIVLAVVWISSRGKFMFLDNVVYDRALVVAPWKQFHRQGNSLFLFTLAVIVAGVALVVLLAAGVALTVGWGFSHEPETVPAFALVAVLVGFVLLLTFAAIYMFFFLDAFVVPLMHRYDLGVLDGWSRFLGLFRSRPLPFLACGLLVFVFILACVVAIVSFGIMTCCIGFILLMIPYLSSVLLLPLTVFYRAFTVEFLAQFDADLLPQPQAPAAPPPLPPPAGVTP